MHSLTFDEHGLFDGKVDREPGDVRMLLLAGSDDRDPNQGVTILLDDSR